jgi:L-lactate dehydrogenase
MRVGFIGAGAVGAASLLSLVMRGLPACEIVVLDKNYARAKGVVADLQYGATLSPAVELRTGDYPDLADAVLTIVTAGINERAGGATDRSDPAGRLKLLDANAKVYRDIVPRIVAVAPQAVILVGDFYAQEYENSFEAAIQGAFYANEMRIMLNEGRICPIDMWRRSVA